MNRINAPFRLVGDPRVPRGSKALLFFGAAWVASPIDLIPEFIPVLGPLDDAVVAALILRHLLKTTGVEVLSEHWRREPADRAWFAECMGTVAKMIGENMSTKLPLMERPKTTVRRLKARTV